jgi:hypothetical protein
MNPELVNFHLPIPDQFSVAVDILGGYGSEMVADWPVVAVPAEAMA